MGVLLAYVPVVTASMPTVLRNGPFRYFFYSNEKGEPPHVHVQRERKMASALSR